LDKKDSAKVLITSHMELLVACLGPVWISTLVPSCSFYQQIPVRLSGLITVGVGDSLAAIVGISLKRPHKISTSGKSWEGTVAFIISVLACLHGINSTSLRFEAIIATLAAAATECFARDHDNVLIPFVFIAVYKIAS
jgi:dolichol kinase